MTCRQIDLPVSVIELEPALFGGEEPSAERTASLPIFSEILRVANSPESVGGEESTEGALREYGEVIATWHMQANV